MFSPVAIEHIQLPDQNLRYWSRFETEQWMRAGQVLNTSNFQYQTGSVRIGPDFGVTDYKWIGGTLGSDGKIYCAPHVRRTILSIDTDTDTVTDSANIGPGNWFSVGGLYDKITNSIYFNGVYPHKLDLNTAASSSINWAGRTGKQGSLEFDGNLAISYQSANVSPTGWKRMNIAANTVANVTTPTVSGGNITLAIDGNFYLGAGETTAFNKLDPITNSTTSVGSVTANRYYTVIQHYNGYIYSFPATSGNAILKIDPITNSITTDATSTVSFSDSPPKLGPDGRIYFINGNLIIFYDPYTQTDGTLLTTGDTSFITLAIGIDGTIVCIPRASRWVNVVKPARGGEFYRGFIRGNLGGRFGHSY